jgi:hypothetical protein
MARSTLLVLWEKVACSTVGLATKTVSPAAATKRGPSFDASDKHAERSNVYSIGFRAFPSHTCIT